jgi:cohesin complex subunit SCC1
MFYSEFILTRKGPLAKIWLAAHWEKKLSKTQVCQTNLVKSVEDIINPSLPLALRLSSQLLLGIVRIYSRQTRYLLEDCADALNRLKTTFKLNISSGDLCVDEAIDLPLQSITAQLHAITLPEHNDMNLDLYLLLTEPSMLTSQDDTASLARSESIIMPERVRRHSMFLDSDVLSFDGFEAADADEIRVYKELEKSLGHVGMSPDISIEMARDAQLEQQQQPFSSVADFLEMDASPLRRSSLSANRRESLQTRIEEKMELSRNEDMNLYWDDQSHYAPVELFDVASETLDRKEGNGQPIHRRSRKRTRLIDERTEFDVKLFRKQLKDTSDIVLTVSSTDQKVKIYSLEMK